MSGNEQSPRSVDALVYKSLDVEPHHNVDPNKQLSLVDERHRGASLRDGSPGSSLGWRHPEKEHGTVPGNGGDRTAPKSWKLHNKEPAQAAPLSDRNFELKTIAPLEKASKTRKSGGIRTALRRLFGKRSTKKYTSLPTPSEPGDELPKTMVAAPTITRLRAVSAPANEVLRSSALGSHAPFPLPTPRSTKSKGENSLPPERGPPERPPRPRRVSLPSMVLSTQDGEAIQQALTGLGLQDLRDESDETRNIGFAITSGSHPHRRSRSVGGYRDSMKEHRMSPIQWRQWRRRSDEIKYWRASVDQLQGLALPASPQLDTKSMSDAEGINESHLEAHNNDFNFDLEIEEPKRDNHGALSHEYSQIEERMITMELTMMRLELALSKLQAGSFSPIDHNSNKFDTGDPSITSHSRTHSENIVPQMPRGANRGRSTPASQQNSFNADTAIESRQRPSSIATTLKASGQYRSSPANISHGHGSRRSSITEVTIEHYTTLITLIRRERSARMRLEEQVSKLSEQMRAMQGQGRGITLQRQQRSSSDLDRQYPLADGGTGHFRSDKRADQIRAGGQARSVDESFGGGSGTDDASFHETYVTPVEREEIEGGAHGLAEGIAF